MAPWISSLAEEMFTMNRFPAGRPSRPDGSVATAIAELQAGRAVIVVGGAAGARSGQLVFAAELATPEIIAFTVRHSSGILCTPMTAVDCDHLDLPPLRSSDLSGGPEFTVSVDAAAVESTGISAVDRALTVNMLGGRDTTADDFTRPGHVFPVRTIDHGVLIKPAHGEAAVDLTRLAGLRPIAVTATIVNDSGAVSRTSRLRRFAIEHSLPIVTIADLVDYRLATETLVDRHTVTTDRRPPRDFEVASYTSTISGHQFAALMHGDIARHDTVIRLHHECTHGTLFGSSLCQCAELFDDHLQANKVRIWTGTDTYRRSATRFCEMSECRRPRQHR